MNGWKRNLAAAGIRYALGLVFLLPFAAALVYVAPDSVVFADRWPVPFKLPASLAAMATAWAGVLLSLERSFRRLTACHWPTRAAAFFALGFAADRGATTVTVYALSTYPVQATLPDLNYVCLVTALPLVYVLTRQLVWPEIGDEPP